MAAWSESEHWRRLVEHGRRHNEEIMSVLRARRAGGASGRTARARLRVQFEPRNVWIGVHWTMERLPAFRAAHLLTIYVCIVPMLPLVFQLRLGVDR